MDAELNRLNSARLANDFRSRFKIGRGLEL
jgi:hypothetical protein